MNSKKTFIKKIPSSLSTTEIYTDITGRDLVNIIMEHHLGDKKIKALIWFDEIENGIANDITIRAL